MSKCAALEAKPRPRRVTRVWSPPETPEQLRELIWRAFRVRIPDVQVCPNHSTPWRAFCDSYFAVSPGCVWKGSRGLAGKTYLLSLLATCEAVFLGVDVNVLGGSGAQSRKALDYIGRFLGGSNIRRGLTFTTVAHKTTLSNGAAIEALLASQTSVRGGHPVRLRLDEVDEMTEAIFDGASGQPMPKKGVKSHLLASSTHQYPDGTMTRTLREAPSKGWRVHEWCHHETSAGPDAWLTPQAISEKRAQMGAEQFRVECDLGEPASGNRAIMPAAVARMFRRELGVVEAGPNGESAPTEIEAPQPTATYAHGGDWAKKTDWTDLWTLRTDCMPMRLVAHERMQRLEWPHMIGRFAARIARFPGAAAHDGTGLGDVVDGYLSDAGVSAEAFILQGAARRALFTEYIKAIEAGEIEAPFIAAVEAEHRFCTVDDLYGSGHPPDSVVAGALAYRASRQVRHVVPTPMVSFFGSAPSGIWGA